MCGIIGYTGPRKATPFLVQGLKLLEYRGYDSAGIALTNESGLKIFKKEGKVEVMENILPKNSAAKCGIGHTRWATHGGVSDANSHPHYGQHNKVAVVHNGIIDNYLELKNELSAQGVVFSSDTDSEVIAQLVELNLAMGPENAVLAALARLSGTWGLGVIFADHPGLIIGSKNGSPMVIGLGDKENFLASDPSAFAATTRQVVYLQDGEIVILRPESWETRDLKNEPVYRQAETLSHESGDRSKGDYDHYFLKEVFEQPLAAKRALGNGGRLLHAIGTAKLGGLNMEKREFFDVQRICFIGMGTAFYASMTGAKIIESWARIPVSFEDASELRTGNPLVEKGTLYFVVSQSGETADCIAAVQEIQQKGGKVLGIINAVGSTLARMCDGGVYIHAGPEVSVASSKAFSNQVIIMGLLGLLLGRMKVLSVSQGQRIIDEFQALPERMQQVLSTREQMKDIAKRHKTAKSFLFMGRGVNWSTALEGALKLKELSYVHAEGFSAGGLKHGPLALVGPDTPSLFIAVEGDTLERTISNMSEVHARKGPIICITNSHDERIRKMTKDVVHIPACMEEFSPLLAVIPLQMLAYYMALELGRDVDRPRNLAKSVTTE